jgi:hypothetical protein
MSRKELFGVCAKELTLSLQISSLKIPEHHPFQNTQMNVDLFAKDGLRTLFLAQREIS